MKERERDCCREANNTIKYFLLSFQGKIKELASQFTASQEREIVISACVESKEERVLLVEVSFTALL